MSGPSPAWTELLVAVDLGLAAPPVVLVRPVPTHVLHVVEGDALRPVVDDLPLGPAGGGEAPAEIVEVGLGDVDREGLQAGHGCDQITDPSTSCI